MAALREEGLAARIGIAPGPANGFTLDLISCLECFGEVTLIQEIGEEACPIEAKRVELAHLPADQRQT